MLLSPADIGATRVLIVKDDAEVADFIRRYLERRGHVVDMASDGLFGLQLAEQESFDAVVLKSGRKAG